MRSRGVLYAAVVLFAVFAMVPTAFATTARGQGLSASKLAKTIKMPTGKRSDMAFTLRTSGGSKIRGYDVSTTKYYERGPNDTGYRRVSKSTAYEVFKNWGGGGYLPARFVYKKYYSKGRTYRVLSTVYYFMNGE